MTTGLRTLFAALVLLAASAGGALAAWDLDALGHALAQAPGGRIPFHEERHISYLKEPLRLSGFLVRDETRLEKHVTVPAPEAFVIDGFHATIRTASGEETTFSLGDHPLLLGLATGLRAALAGETDALQRDFDVALDGTEADWLLRLFPRSETLRRDLREIGISGHGARVSTIQVLGMSGDSSIMTLEHPTP